MTGTRLCDLVERTIRLGELVLVPCSLIKLHDMNLFSQEVDPSEGDARQRQFCPGPIHRTEVALGSV